ncbi:FecR family protein [Paenochrobactrum sp. BZR 588]|uniref:FecR family protein n=1 Tax=unclassified Paenochrobactrum TaxID=2639760 RepID=UPI0038553B70
MVDDHRSPLIREALHWFAVLRDDGATEKDYQAFEQWKSQSAEHEAAWMRASTLWSAFAPVEAELRQTRRTKLSRRAFISSSLGLFGAAGGGYLFYRNGMFADYATNAGELRTLTLTDGSVVDLGSRSALSVNYSDAGRHLTLHWGEAYFNVVPERRPFIVNANDGQTTALGTSFNIKADHQLVTVAVTQHQVEIALPNLPAKRLNSGWQLAYNGDEILAAQAVDINNVDAWRRGRLIYHNEALSSVLNDIERYRGGFIILTDKRLGQMLVSAAFSTASADAALDSIAQTLPINVSRAGNLVIISGR